MKTIKFIILAVIFSSLIFACNQESSSKKESKNNTVKAMKPDPTQDLISKDTFDVWVERWNMEYKEYMNNDSLHYFDMPLIDLRDILNDTTATEARFYMGMGMDTVNISGKETILALPHLMLVGVNKNGVPNFNVIADYTKTCPPFCNK